MTKTIYVIVLLFAFLLLLGACAKTVINPDPDEERVKNGATITYVLYGGFTPMEYVKLVLVITPEKAVLSSYSPDDKLTYSAEKMLTSQEYDEIIRVMNENKFMQLKGLYKPGPNDPVVADASNLDITMEYQETVKKVSVQPYVDFVMSEGLKKIDAKISEINNELFEIILSQRKTEMKFQPMQCENMLWQSWYEEGEIQFGKNPTQEQLIVGYYLNQHKIELQEVRQIPLTEGVVCEACNICKTGYYFTAKVSEKDVAVLEEDGWTRI